MKRDELWSKGWHTHRRAGFDGHMVYRGVLGEIVAQSDIARFPWEEGHQELWDNEGTLR